jgi:endonuclease/exonuclease/phosphatase family metal-dependent hydrolase
LFARFEWQINGRTESLVVLVVHLRATADAADLRRKQCKLSHSWMKAGIEAGENRIILGDFNVEELAGEATEDGDGMFDILGKRTATEADDLFDLLQQLPPEKRKTHLILDKQFDRILVSKPMLATATGPGIKFLSMEVLSQHNIRGNEVDLDHWDSRYTKDRSERDISDHHPVMATFEFRN